MSVLEARAYTKLNLSLDVLNRRSDGYHEMYMIMQTVTLSDALRLETGTGKPLSMRGSLGFPPADKRNLAMVTTLRPRAETGTDCNGLSTELGKSVPVYAGLAGGSADAAAVLRGLSHLLGSGFPLERLGATGTRVSSDVPYCIQGGTALAERREEVLTILPVLPDCHMMLCKPTFSVPTPELFARPDGYHIRRRPSTVNPLAALAAGDSTGVARRMYNVFEDVLPEWQSTEIQRIESAPIQQGALGASMSGTGSTALGLLNREEIARRACELLQESCRDAFLTHSLEKMVQKPTSLSTMQTLHNGR